MRIEIVFLDKWYIIIQIKVILAKRRQSAVCIQKGSKRIKGNHGTKEG